jgi:PadR family transcriptional regulator, regulatory protein PadR
MSWGAPGPITLVRNTTAGNRAGGRNDLRCASLTSDAKHKYFMPMIDRPNPVTPAGALPLLILRVLQSGPIHGYAIAQRIHVLSSEVLAIEEGLLYPTLQKMLVRGWVLSEWGISETNRKVRFYRLTAAGRRQLEAELRSYDRVTRAIQEILRTA